MKTSALLLSLVLISSGCATRTVQSAVTTVALESAATTIVGVLGLPLGTVAEIEAVVVPVPPRPIIGPTRQWYGLRIEVLNGKRLELPKVAQFAVQGPMMVTVARDSFELEGLLTRLVLPDQFSELVSPAEVGSAVPLPAAEVEALRAHYVGSRHYLLVYETGRFSGTPTGLPEEFGWFFGPHPAFKFESYLVVFAETKLNKAPEPTPGSVTPRATEGASK